MIAWTKAVHIVALMVWCAGLLVLPVFTVGDATAAAARAAGFATVHSADGAVGDLVRLITGRLPPAAGAVLHLAGEHRAGDLVGDLAAAGHAARSVVLYGARPVARLPDDAAAMLAAGGVDAALVYSARTAAALVAAAAAGGLAPALARLPCLGLSEAALAPLARAGGRDLRAAAAPNENALFALLDGLAGPL